jgi:hypothetical protein
LESKRDAKKADACASSSRLLPISTPFEQRKTVVLERAVRRADEVGEVLEPVLELRAPPLGRARTLVHGPKRPADGLIVGAEQLERTRSNRARRLRLRVVSAEAAHRQRCEHAGRAADEQMRPCGGLERELLDRARRRAEQAVVLVRAAVVLLEER